MTLRDTMLLFQQRAVEIKDRKALVEQRDADVDDIAAAMTRMQNKRGKS